MNRPHCRVVAVVVCAVAMSAASQRTAIAEEPEPKALMRRVFDALPKVAFVAEGKLTIPGGFERSLELSHKEIDGADAIYLEVTAPFNLKGTRFLFFERLAGPDQQATYLPALNRAIDVHDEARKQPFLGSDFYVSDLVSPNIDAFDYSFVGREDVGGRECRVVEAIPKDPDTELYGKNVLTVDPADLLLMKAQFFDHKGKLLKVWSLDKVEKVDGYWTPFLQRMTNVQRESESTLELVRVRYNVELSDDVFTKSHLKR